MFNVSDLTTEQLINPSTLSKINEETNRIIRQFDSKDAFALSRYLKTKTTESIEIKEIYKEIIPKLDFIAIGLLKTPEVKTLIREHFGITLLFPFDIITPLDLIRVKLFESSFIDDELMREEISKALKENDNIITKNHLEITEKTDKIIPSIKNWILDYDLRLNDKPSRSMARVEYFTSSPNILKLSDEEKEKVKQLMIVYDFVNTSSLFMSAFAEDMIVHWPNNCSFVISQGETVASLPPLKDENIRSFLTEKKNKTKSLEQKFFEEGGDE